MAEATISHFREFHPLERIDFTGRVMNAVAKHVYGVDQYEDIAPPNGVTVIANNLGADSHSDSPSGTEVKVDLDAEEWGVDKTTGLLLRSPELLNAYYEELAANIGRQLVGGVMRESGLEVFTWVRQFPATGWYDGS